MLGIGCSRGASNYTYAKARWSEVLADWIGLHVNAPNAIGGVPNAVVCDNLNAGVTATYRYEPGINRTYQELGEHYGTAILPTRPRKSDGTDSLREVAKPTLLLAL